jgi:protein arginine N-methyltransferase 1
MSIRLSNGLIEYHRELLADEARTLAFREAITHLVRPGDIVVDLGSGTGIMAMFACQAGAAKVYAIESAGIAEVAQRLIKDNGFSDRIVLINEISTKVDLPEKGDVIVSETLGNVGLEEAIMVFLADARKRFLRPGGRVSPRAVECFFAPVESVQAYHLNTGFWSERRYGFNFEALHERAANLLQAGCFVSDDLLAEPASCIRVDLLDSTSSSATGTAVFEVVRPGTLHGFAAWFRADLTERQWFGTAPPNPMPNWRHGFFPLERPISVYGNDLINFSVTTLNGLTWKWAGTISSPDGAVKACFNQSTVSGVMHNRKVKELEK